MKLIDQLAKIISSAGTPEDASILVVEFLNRHQKDLKESLDVSSDPYYKLMIEKLNHDDTTGELLRNTVARSLCKDLEDPEMSDELAIRTVLEIMWLRGIEIEQSWFEDDEISHLCKIISKHRNKQNSANLIAVELIEYLDNNGLEIYKSGLLENDSEYNKVACML